MEEWEEAFANIRVNWFPGHMVKAQQHMRARLKQVDVVLEVRDARIPFSSANHELDKLIGNKARLVVLNKRDLANVRLEKTVKERLAAEGKRVVFTNGSDGPGGGQGVGGALRWARETGALRGKFVTLGAMAMVVGMPNVGKSTLINHMRRICKTGAAGAGRKVARVGATPGVTRALDCFKVADPPHPLYMVDTPGVMVPRVASPTVGLRLALTAAVPDAAVGEEVLVDYLCAMLNARGMVTPCALALGLPATTTALQRQELLQAAERLCGATGKLEHQRIQMAARHVLSLFRSGAFGRMSMDAPDQPYPHEILDEPALGAQAARNDRQRRQEIIHYYMK